MARTELRLVMMRCLAVFWSVAAICAAASSSAQNVDQFFVTGATLDRFVDESTFADPPITLASGWILFVPKACSACEREMPGLLKRNAFGGSFVVVRHGPEPAAAPFIEYLGSGADRLRRYNVTDRSNVIRKLRALQIPVDRPCGARIATNSEDTIYVDAVSCGPTMAAVIASIYSPFIKAADARRIHGERPLYSGGRTTLRNFVSNWRRGLIPVDPDDAPEIIDISPQFAAQLKGTFTGPAESFVITETSGDDDYRVVDKLSGAPMSASCYVPAICDKIPLDVHTHPLGAIDAFSDVDLLGTGNSARPSLMVNEKAIYLAVPTLRRIYSRYNAPLMNMGLMADYIPELRSHGKSSGKVSTYGLKESYPGYLGVVTYQYDGSTFRRIHLSDEVAFDWGREPGRGSVGNPMFRRYRNMLVNALLAAEAGRDMLSPSVREIFALTAEPPAGARIKQYGAMDSTYRGKDMPKAVADSSGLPWETLDFQTLVVRARMFRMLDPSYPQCIYLPIVGAPAEVRYELCVSIIYNDIFMQRFKAGVREASLAIARYHCDVPEADRCTWQVPTELEWAPY